MTSFKGTLSFTLENTTENRVVDLMRIRVRRSCFGVDECVYVHMSTSQISKQDGR